MDSNGPSGRVTSRGGSARRAGAQLGDDAAGERREERDPARVAERQQAVAGRAGARVVGDRAREAEQRAEHRTEEDHQAARHRLSLRGQHGDVDLDGQLLGLIRGNGCALDPGRYIEKPGLDERIAAAGQDVAAVRRMLLGEPVRA